jgi:hypothetical protein
LSKVNDSRCPVVFEPWTKRISMPSSDWYTLWARTPGLQTREVGLTEGKALM